jgi:hypothetical protein
MWTWNLLKLLPAGVLAAVCAAGVTATARADDQKNLATEARRMDSLAASQGQTRVTNRIASDFSAFAGSDANSRGLVTGLRSGTPITLTSAPGQPPSSVIFTPPTRPMGYGNTFISMSLAKQQLATYGITQPTPEQLRAAMVGGTITGANGQTVTLTGVLNQRASGMGWGQIANSMGVKLGPVVSGIKSANSQVPRTPSAPTTAISPGVRGGQVPGGGAGKGITTPLGPSGAPGQVRKGIEGGQSGVVTGGGSPPGGGVGAEHGKGRSK